MKFSIPILFLLIGILAGMLIMKSCNDKKEPAKGSVIMKSDTSVTVKKDSTPPHKPKPVQVTPPSMAKDNNAIEWLSPEVIRIPDSAAYYQVKAAYDELLFKYTKLYDLCAATKEYDEVYPFGKDTVRVKNTVQANDIWSQQAFLTKSNTVITNIVQQKLRNSLWLGVDGYYRDTTMAVGASLMFQQKRGWGIEVGAAINHRGGKEFRAGYKRNFLR